jgi:hypothetical protein
MPESMDSAVRGPTPEILMSSRKRLALGRRGKAVQQLRILAHDELREQAHAFAHGGQVVEGAHGHLHLVTHAVAVQQHLGGILLQQGAGQFAYHWMSFAGARTVQSAVFLAVFSVA